MKFPPDDFRDIILRTEEQRRALLEPYFKQAEMQARLAENLITNRIDRSMVDRFAAAASALDLKGFGHLGIEHELRLAGITGLKDFAADAAPLAGLTPSIGVGFEAANKHLNAAGLFEKLDPGRIGAIADLNLSALQSGFDKVGLAESAFLNLAAQASFSRLELLELDALSGAARAGQRLITGVERMSRLYECTFGELEAVHGAGGAVAELLPRELFGQATLVELIVPEEPDARPSEAAREAFVAIVRPQLREAVAGEHPRLALALTAVDEAFDSRGSLWVTNFCSALRYAFEEGMLVFAPDMEVMKWLRFLETPSFRRERDGKPTWRARVHYVARHVDPQLTTFPKFVGCTLKEVRDSLEYLNSHCHPTDCEIDLLRLQTAQARVEGVLLFMLLLSTPLSA